MAAIRGKKLSIENHASAAGAGFRAAGAAVRTFKLAKEIADKERDQAASPSEDGSSSSDGGAHGLSATQMKATQDNLPLFLEAMWHISVVDIERTITAVTHKVCKDHSVPEVERTKRAEAIGVLARIFMDAAVEKGGSKDPKAQVAQMVKMVLPSQTNAPGGETPAPAAAPPGGESSRHACGPAVGVDREEAAYAARALTLDELRALPIKRLKRLVHLRRLSQEASEIVEKEELVQLLLARQESGTHSSEQPERPEVRI